LGFLGQGASLVLSGILMPFTLSGLLSA